MSLVNLQFHGAAQTVTGSMHLLHCDGRVVVQGESLPLQG